MFKMFKDIYVYSPGMTYKDLSDIWQPSWDDGTGIQPNISPACQPFQGRRPMEIPQHPPQPSPGTSSFWSAQDTELCLQQSSAPIKSQSENDLALRCYSTTLCGAV